MQLNPLVVMGEAINNLFVISAKIKDGSLIPKWAEIKTRSIIDQNGVWFDIDGWGNVEEKITYSLDSNELHLLEMAERRYVRTLDKDGRGAIHTVWNWIAKRSGVKLESIEMIPGTQQFKAIPVETQTRSKAS